MAHPRGGAWRCAGGLLLQWWTNATDARQFGFLPVHFQGFAFPISGKPMFSLPANIPVIFELTVLFAALATVIGMLAMNNLPLLPPAAVGPAALPPRDDRPLLSSRSTRPTRSLTRTRTAEFLTSLGGRWPVGTKLNFVLPAPPAAGFRRRWSSAA